MATDLPPDTALTTASGRMLDLRLGERLDPSDILVEDIAGPLSKICRFGGQTQAFLSVAQHVELVMRIVAETDTNPASDLRLFTTILTRPTWGTSQVPLVALAGFAAHS